MLALLVIVGSSIVFYDYLGYGSVSSTVLQLELKIYRVRAADNSSITFHIPAMIWSRGMLLDVDVGTPAFSLEADMITIGSIVPSSAIMHPGHCLIFPLIFQTTNATASRILSGQAFNSVLLTMRAVLSSGLYNHSVLRSVSEQVYDTPVSIDAYACRLDVLPQSSNV